MPLDTRLRLDDKGDRLSLAYNTFTAEVDAAAPSDAQLPLRITVRRKGTFEEAFVTLQLVLKPGEAVETAAGRRFTAGADRVALEAGDLGGSLRHRGWTLSWSGQAQLAWPVYPYNPYAEGPETSLEYAVGALTFPLSIASGEREAVISLKVEGR